MMRVLPLLVLLLPSLVGCHLFASGEIETTCDDLPGCAEPGTVTDGTDDTGTPTTTTDDTEEPTETGEPAETGGPTETGEDTEPPVDTDTEVFGERERGLVLFAVSKEKKQFALWVYDPADALLQEMLFNDAELDRHYPVAWDNDTERLWVGFSSFVFALDLATKDELADVEIGDEVVELLMVDGELWVIGEASVGRVTGGGAGAPTYTRIVDGVFTELAGGLHAPSRNAVEVVDVDRSTPDLWRINQVSLAAEVIATDYDNQEARSRMPFAGDDDDPWSCTGSGAVHSLISLRDGDREPERLINQSVTDIFNCDYDPGSGEVVMFSSEFGALRVGADGEADRFALPDSYFLISGAVW